MAAKKCSRCDQLKGSTEFSPDRRASDGLQAACRSCCNEASKRRRKENYDAVRAQERRYFEANKDRIYANSAKSRERHREEILARKRKYYEHVKRTPEYQAKSKEYRESRKEEKRRYDRDYATANSRKKVQQAKEWARLNKAKRAAIVRAYDGRRRSIKRQGVSGPELAAWCEQQEKKCHWCAKSCADNFHIDHYMPLSKGGQHEVSNLVISCATCNLRKNAKHPDDFAKEVGRVTITPEMVS